MGWLHWSCAEVDGGDTSTLDAGGRRRECRNKWQGAVLLGTVVVYGPLL
jgi:hypothetical protein